MIPSNIIIILHNNMIWLVPHHRGDHRCMCTKPMHMWRRGGEGEVTPSVSRPGLFSVSGPYVVHPWDTYRAGSGPRGECCLFSNNISLWRAPWKTMMMNHDPFSFNTGKRIHRSPRWAFRTLQRRVNDIGRPPQRSPGLKYYLCFGPGMDPS